MQDAILTAQVKRKLNITWSDDDTDARVEDIISSAKPIIRHKLGITDEEFDFGTAGLENTLLLSYCLYEWNNAVNEWDNNYANEILQARAKYEVAHYTAEQAQEGEADVQAENL